MPPPKNPPKGKPQTGRAKMRTDPRDSTTPEIQYEIENALEGRKYLEKYLLLCPPGELPTHTPLATCLYQVANLPGVTKLILNAVRSVALLLEEMEETPPDKRIRERSLRQSNNGIHY